MTAFTILASGYSWSTDALEDVDVWGEGACKEEIKPYAFAAVQEFNKKAAALTGYQITWDPYHSRVNLEYPKGKSNMEVEDKITKILIYEGYGTNPHTPLWECLEALKLEVMEVKCDEWFRSVD